MIIYVIDSRLGKEGSEDREGDERWISDTVTGLKFSRRWKNCWVVAPELVSRTWGAWSIKISEVFFFSWGWQSQGYNHESGWLRMMEGKNEFKVKYKTELANLTNGSKAFNVELEQNWWENVATSRILLFRYFTLSRCTLRADLLSHWSLAPGLGWSF